MRTSALRGTGVHRRVPSCSTCVSTGLGRASTSAVNDSVHAAQRDHPTARGQGTFHYATQVCPAPPSFVVFGARAPDATYRRYLENRLRRDFELDGAARSTRTGASPGPRRRGARPRPAGWGATGRGAAW